MKSSFCIDLQRFMLIPTKFPLTRNQVKKSIKQDKGCAQTRCKLFEHTLCFLS